MSSRYYFLPWTRKGMASHLQAKDLQAQKDNPNAQPKLKGYGKLSVDLSLRTQSHGPSAVDKQEPLDAIDLYLFGPGDIIGIDRRQIIRTEPEANSQNFLTNYLAAIEFERPDFPWLFTPAKAEKGHERLRPWICLIVVKQQEGVSLKSVSGRPLPTLRFDTPAIANQELPNLTESWAWAHSQVIHQTGSLGDTLNQKPDLTLSRLLCPRRLEENTHYYACVVPTFEVGRKVGLNIPFAGEEADINTQTLDSAWNTPGSIEFDESEGLELPVYYHWEFRTGQGGDFKDLAQKLTPRTYRRIGSRKLYVGDGGIPGWQDMGVVDLEGVFRPVRPSPASIEPAEENWKDELKAELQRVANVQSQDNPIVGPPIYAQYQSSLQAFPEDDTQWISDLNLNVRHRVAAGLGVFLVQKLQEELMHSAWQQLGDIQEVEQRKRQAQLGNEVNQKLYQKNFAPLVHDLDSTDDPSGSRNLADLYFYQLTAPAHSRIPLENSATLPQAAQEQQTSLIAPTYQAWSRSKQLPSSGTTSAFRKLSRPKGAIAKRMQAAASLEEPITVKSSSVGKTIPESLNSALKPLGNVRLDLLGQRKLWQARSQTSGSGGLDTAALSRMESVLETLNPYLLALNTPTSDDGTLILPVNRSFGDNISQLDNSLNPNATVPTDQFISLTQTSSNQSQNGQEETIAINEPIPHPTFPQAMYKPVQEFAADYLLPGADRIDENTVTVLDINGEFIEAFMLGLNHEMARELLWRNYPTDQRGTYFQNFWSQDTIDLEKIHLWFSSSPLGTALKAGWQAQIGEGQSSDQLALIVRGELLRRFPHTIIYAIEAASETSLGSDRKYPIHRGTLGDGIVFLLFNLDETEAGGNPGWFFIFQQQPTEARFGLNSDPTKPDLSWDDTGIAPGDYLSAVAIPPPLAGNQGTEPVWDFNSAHTAEILLRKPFSLGIHAKRLLPNAQPNSANEG